MGVSARRVAVTGASGFIGRHLTAALSRRGDAVTPIARPFEAAALAAAFRRVDAAVHLAGLIAAVRPGDFFAANVDAVRTVAAAAAAAAIPLVHISSLAAAGPAPAAAPRSEPDPPAPITPYGRSKLEGERALEAQADLRWTILRPGVVYGPGDRGMLPLFRYAARGILPIVGDPDAAYTMIHVDDAVRAIIAAIDHEPARETMFVGHPRPVVARQLADAVAAAVGRRATVIRVPRVLLKGAAIAGDILGAVTNRPAVINRHRYAEVCAGGFVCRVDRLRERLGVVAAVDLIDGLARTAVSYRASGWIAGGRS
jgi:nucleoside-diphosphate-sugar epimerase